MAPNYTRTNYNDDRRASISRGESYRPGNDRSLPPRRDPRDSRYTSDSGGTRSPHENRPPREHRRDNEPPRPHNDTNFNPPEGPKRWPSNSASSLPDKPTFKPPESSKRIPNNSEAGLPDKPGDGLHFKRVNIASDKHLSTNNSVLGDSVTLAIPKAKDPKLQEAFEKAYNWGEKHNKRLLLGIRKNKLAQESTQQRIENEKFLQKASSYPPYIGLGEAFKQADRTFDDQFKVADDEYLDQLEQLVARFTTVSEPGAINPQDPVIAALEAKVEQISHIAATQNEQIQSLLEANNKFDSLKLDYDELQLKLRAVDDTVRALQSQQVTMDNENKILKKQLEDLQSNTEGKMESCNVQLAELAKQSSDAAEARGVFETRLDERFRGIETMLATFTDYDNMKEKLDELDVKTFNEICEAWIFDLKRQYDEYKQRRHPDDPSIYETLRSLRQGVDSLLANQANASQLDKEETFSMERIDKAIDTKIEAAKNSMKEDTGAIFQERDDLVVRLIDNTSARVSALEREGSNHSEFDTRIQLLEQWRIEQSQGPTLAERVTNLEGTKVGHRVDRIDIEVGELHQKYKALGGEVLHLAKREWVELLLKELPDVKDLQRRVPAVEHAIRVLDSQYQNLSTKQLAEHIVRFTNPVFEQRLGKIETKINQLDSRLLDAASVQRLGKVEIKANELELRMNGNDRTVARHTEQLLSLHDRLRLIGISERSGEKRTASPGSLDEVNKRRKLEVNGRYPGLQQQQEQNTSDGHPSP
ncbi:hypothetical protein F5Y09DRAFT_271474 [Xylaria sp. FL1042]|nr:hypothetical protein F5Y09DRAFT_271474 [Xylaria sp. FL1042]